MTSRGRDGIVKDAADCSLFCCGRASERAGAKDKPRFTANAVDVFASDAAAVAATVDAAAGQHQSSSPTIENVNC